MKKQIPFLDLSQFPTDLKSSLKRKFADMLEVGIFSGGEEVFILERQLRDITGSREAIACSNGTDALEIALKILGIGPGDEVILPTMSWVSTAEAIVLLGAKPIFVDTDEDGLMDLHQLDSVLTSSTKAIVPVHLYGKMVDMKKLTQWARPKGLLVVEDAAQALGATQDGKAAGTWGDIGCLSFYPTKNLGALGEAGALLTQDSEIGENLRLFINHGQVERGNHITLGRNARIDSIQAGFLNVKLQHFANWQTKRKAIASTYLDAMSALPGLRVPQEILRESHNAHLFVVGTEKRSDLVSFLDLHGIGTAIHYPLILPKMEPFKVDEDFPVSQKLSERILSIPLNPWMSEVEVKSVAQAIRAFYSKTS